MEERSALKLESAFPSEEHRAGTMSPSINCGDELRRCVCVESGAAPDGAPGLMGGAPAESP